MTFSKILNDGYQKTIEVFIDGEYVGQLYFEVYDSPQTEWAACADLEALFGENIACGHTNSYHCKRELKQAYAQTQRETAHARQETI